MRKPLISTVAVAVVAGAVAIPAVAGTRSVEVGDNYFVRDAGGATVKLHKGQSLRWRWEGKAAHNVTVSKGPQRFHSKTQSSGSYTHRFTKAGSYTIFCTIHGPKMSMKVVVK